MDIRSQKTRQNISNCFIALLKEKPASKITVTELCYMAQINRATFYKHYLDIPDLQEKLEQEIIADFEDFINKRFFSTSGQYRGVLVELLTYTQLFGEKFYALCSENAASTLPAQLFQRISAQAFSVLQERIPQIDEGRAKLLYHYVTSGCGSILAHWLSGESGMTTEEVVDYLMLVTGGSVNAVFLDGEGVD